MSDEEVEGEDSQEEAEAAKGIAKIIIKALIDFRGKQKMETPTY